MTSHYARRSRKPLSHKPRGRAGNTHSRLTTLEMRQHIRKLYRTGEWTYKQLAEAFNFSAGTIQRVMDPEWRKEDELALLAQKIREALA